MSNYRQTSIPFERIAVAITLSPRIAEMVCEGFRFAQAFNATLYFLHVGKNEIGSLTKIRNVINQYNKQNYPYDLVVEEGDVVDTLLNTSKDLEIDLLIAGALEKENTLKYLIGSVSRTICRKAKCSVLMLSEPSIHKTAFDRIVVSCIDNKKTSHTLDAAIYTGKHLQSKEIHLVKEDSLSNVVNLVEESVPEEDFVNFYRNKVIEENKIFCALEEDRDFGSLCVKHKVLKGKPGLEIANYTRKLQAELLVLNSPDSELGILDRFFPHNHEYILEDLPCSLLIVHTRLN